MPTGQTGGIFLRGPTVMKGYRERPVATAETLRGGWPQTGDVGFSDEYGYLYIVDRKKDMIISGGMNICVREVEEVVAQHPAVYDCAVIGVPHPVWGEAVTAIVVLRPGWVVTEQEIVDLGRQHLASFKKPQSVEFVAQIPRNAYGKVLKRELREGYGQRAQR